MAKAKMTKEEWESEVELTVAELPCEPPEGTVETLCQRGILGKDILLYGASRVYDPLQDRKRKMVKVHCTYCGEETHLEHIPLEGGCFMNHPPAPFGFEEITTKETIYHGLPCLCPSCGAGVEAIHIGRFRSIYNIEAVTCMSLHNVRGHLALLTWYIIKYCNKEGRIFYNIHRCEGMFLCDHRPVRVTGHRNSFGYSEEWFSRWERRKRFDDETGDWLFDEIINPDIELVESTDCAYSALGEYIKNCGKKISPSKYLLLWAKHPNLENLVRAHCSRFIADVIDECTGYVNTYAYTTFKKDEVTKYINFKAVKPNEMLGIEKDEMCIVKNYPLKIIEFYKWVKSERNLRFGADILDKINTISVPCLKELLSKKFGRFAPPIVRTVNYIIKQRAAHGSLIAPRYLGDYWDMLLKVYRRMPEELLFPRDLKNAHDDIMLRVKEKENKALTRKIKERFTQLDALSYSSEALGLLIRPAASQAELIKEGKMLHHCVGGYARDHANGKTSIFFIRHIDKPEIPFFTLEYRNGKVNQNRGDHNCGRTEEVIAFEAEWLNYISKLKEIHI